MPKQERSTHALESSWRAFSIPMRWHHVNWTSYRTDLSWRNSRSLRKTSDTKSLSTTIRYHQILVISDILNATLKLSVLGKDLFDELESRGWVMSSLESQKMIFSFGLYLSKSLASCRSRSSLPEFVQPPLVLEPSFSRALPLHQILSRSRSLSERSLSRKRFPIVHDNQRDCCSHIQDNLSWGPTSMPDVSSVTAPCASRAFVSSRSVPSGVIFWWLSCPLELACWTRDVAQQLVKSASGRLHILVLGNQFVQKRGAFIKTECWDLWRNSKWQILRSIVVIWLDPTTSPLEQRCCVSRRKLLTLMNEKKTICMR